MEVDEVELKRALDYDRAQYEKGFNDVKEQYEKVLNKALWALSELMGDKGIYISLGYKDLYFASFEELRKWIENE